MRPTALIVGTGLTACVAAYELRMAGWVIDMVEAQQRIGGNVVPQRINGMHFEPDGPHIVHTNQAEVIRWLALHVRLNGYTHTVKADTEAGLLNWPPQINELKNLADWPQIEKELDARPASPDPTNFETYAIGLMGETLYRWFIRDYTRKQWGCEPKELASSFAPKRIDLRDDDYLPLFRDAIQGWPVGGWQPVVERLVRGVKTIHMGHRATMSTVNPEEYTGTLVTAPLDDFLEEDEPLEWRGIQTESTYYPTQFGFRLPAPVVNCPQANVPYTRMTESKQMSGQVANVGTVITYEFPGAPVRHYPVDDVDGVNRRRANRMRKRLKELCGENVFAAGRLATYSYIDMDEAITQGLHVANKMKELWP